MVCGTSTIWWQQIDRFVSIPERVWWFVEPPSLQSSPTPLDGSVSIPERVWWFVEPLVSRAARSPCRFQSLKGFGGLWNPANLSLSSGLKVSIPERVWWFVEHTMMVSRRYCNGFQSLKGFGGLWNQPRFIYPSEKLCFNP